MNRLVLIFVCVMIAEMAHAQQSPHGPLTIPCESCHSSDSWMMRANAQFDHPSTGFSLQGKHRTTDCLSCHHDLRFEKQDTRCTSCHTDIHQSELGSNCLRCHTMESWIVSDMKQRHQETRFPLVGRHLRATCESCHDRTTSQRFAATPVSCISCHSTEYQATTAPAHVQSGFSTECSSCHNITASQWDGSFDHNLTAFPLAGAHRAVLCSQCHQGNRFTKLPTDCFSCHDDDYTRTQSPAHVAGNFNHDCLVCHTMTAWSPATFDHNQTGFPLTGKHRTAQCQSCHVNGNYQLTYANCAQCHQRDFQQATNPSHLTSAFSQECQSCHTTSGWRPAAFDHNQTQFALTGSHIATACISCHDNNNYQLRYADCYQCHRTDFEQPTDPSHVSANFNHNCEPCHTTSAWKPATFDHAATRFPLTGRHITAACQLCHVNGNYQLTYSNCVQCHQQDFNQTTNPNHLANNIGQECESCHSTSGWSPAQFDHYQTSFALTGSHIAAACNSCHTNGNYQLTYADCYQCHQADFQQPTNPNHVAASYSHDCTPCHTTTAWSPSTFNHDAQYFRIYSGKHRGRWSLCSDCHTTPTNHQLFSCIVCHEHNRTETDGRHQSVTNYSYTSSACYSCHRNV